MINQNYEMITLLIFFFYFVQTCSTGDISVNDGKISEEVKKALEDSEHEYKERIHSQLSNILNKMKDNLDQSVEWKEFHPILQQILKVFEDEKSEIDKRLKKFGFGEKRVSDASFTSDGSGIAGATPVVTGIQTAMTVNKVGRKWLQQTQKQKQ